MSGLYATAFAQFPRENGFSAYIIIENIKNKELFGFLKLARTDKKTGQLDVSAVEKVY